MHIRFGWSGREILSRSRLRRAQNASGKCPLQGRAGRQRRRRAHPAGSAGGASGAGMLSRSLGLPSTARIRSRAAGRLCGGV